MEPVGWLSLGLVPGLPEICLEDSNLLSLLVKDTYLKKGLSAKDMILTIQKSLTSIVLSKRTTELNISSPFHTVNLFSWFRSPLSCLLFQNCDCSFLGQALSFMGLTYGYIVNVSYLFFLSLSFFSLVWYSFDSLSNHSSVQDYTLYMMNICAIDFSFNRFF